LSTPIRKIYISIEEIRQSNFTPIGFKDNGDGLPPVKEAVVLPKGLRNPYTEVEPRDSNPPRPVVTGIRLACQTGRDLIWGGRELPV
jgi:hypothetical protein